MLSQAAVAFWAPAVELAGSHSRDYDTIFGSAGMDWAYALTGIADAAGMAGDSYIEFGDPITEAHLYVSWLRGELPQAPAEVLSLAPTPSDGDWRVMQSSWSDVPGDVLPTNGSDAYLFVASHATLGTSSLYYGQQDKQVVAQLAVAANGTTPEREPRLAQITLVQDQYDRPYGTVLTGGKPTHLKATVAGVQFGGMALSAQDLTMSLELSSNPGPFSSIGVNLVFPAGAGVDAVYVGGVDGVQRVTNISSGAPSVPLPLDTTVAVRSAGGVVAFRVPFVDGLAGYAPESWLKFDGPIGTDCGRLVTYLYQGPNVTFPQVPPPSRSITLIAVGDAASDSEAAAFVAALAALRVSNVTTINGSDTDWFVTVQPAPPDSGDPPQATLALAQWFSSVLEASFSVPRKEILNRMINVTAMHMPAAGTLEVNWANGTSVILTPASF